MTALKKEQRLRKKIKDLGSVVVAFSGGVDSSYLAYIAREELGEKSLAVTAVSSTYPSRQRKDARTMAEEIGVAHREIESEELDIGEFSDNPPNRCYYCKGELFEKLKEIAREGGYEAVLDGTNRDDLSDHRPGMKAAREIGVLSPLMEAGFTKEDIRKRSKEAGLSSWDKPAFACLASRFPYGSKITADKLDQADAGEEFLRDLGFRQLRVRHHGETVRIEIAPEEMERIFARPVIDSVVARFKELGFHYVTLDLEGYRTGSMNEVLEEWD